MDYNTTDKEALAIMNVVISLHHLLAGNKFTIVTEHQPLMYLMTSRTSIKRAV